MKNTTQRKELIAIEPAEGGDFGKKPGGGGRDRSYTGPLAGYQAGEFSVDGRRVLVTRGPELIAPDAGGDWPVLRGLLEHLLGPEQTPYFYGWLKSAAVALRKGRCVPGQCLVLA